MKTSKKESKSKTTTAELLPADMQNTINLNLNNADIIELMIEEQRDIKVKAYLALAKELMHLNFAETTHPELVALMYKDVNPELTKVATKLFPDAHLSVAFLNNYCRSNKTYAILDFEYELNSKGLPQRALRTVYEPYCLLDVRKQFPETKFKATVSFLPKKNSQFADAYLSFSITLSDKTVEAYAKKEKELNAELKAKFQALEALHKDLQELTNKAKIKAKFTRSVLEQSAEGQRILGSIGALSSTKLLS